MLPTTALLNGSARWLTDNQPDSKAQSHWLHAHGAAVGYVPVHGRRLQEIPVVAISSPYTWPAPQLVLLQFVRIRERLAVHSGGSRYH
jgi:hypothetical protein